MAAASSKKENKKQKPQIPSAVALASPLSAFKFPFAIAIAILLVSLLPRVHSNSVVMYSFWGAAALLLAWQGYLAFLSQRTGEIHNFKVVLRPQHYIQAMLQVCVYSYWGYYWRPVYDHFWLIVVQLLFAYGFDMLLSWSRRREYSLGFGPFPIILSINLFLWFRDDWFYMQFLMIMVGFMGKEYVRWQREGRSTHIFNPSAFALGLFSLVLILTNTTGLTWGQEIASTLTLAPNIYTFLFLIGLVVMYFFSITLVAGMSAITLFALSALYSASTGVPYFLDSEIPAAVFLGLHLLITDPSTSPRTPLGKTLFGVLYAFGVFALYTLLDNLGSPTFYDKLLCVPLLNLSVIAIDRAVRSIKSESILNVWRKDWLGGKANLAHMAVWIFVFGVMTLAGKTDGRHIGDSLPFWEQACAENLPNACGRVLLLESTYCGDNAAWACNELGRHYRQGDIVDVDEELSFSYFARGCELKFQSSCLNMLDTSLALTDTPLELDMRLMLREGGLNLMQLSAADLNARACEHGWEFACESRSNL
ncbi:MAG: hypothetical protein HOF74_11835 [Gammaproteobacteria bacterium]|jgi:hypothetical protein|nr:hypothetical protein [Gammaproteobacteria bacterium]MBT3860516.1 hypothetical protein [Gammaproteobacteria bacterium]MBT3987358.1 hypothetical protein [Gammaproteobacteria bacterium]MBT4581904.1 hypothetical protein [Gammaproteobacteria bacterium]MBT4659764.1 hypothetical protein [Gammaproteobacteria bacterium]